MPVHISALPVEVNLALYAGDSFGPLLLTVTDPAGAPADLTGYTAAAEIRTARDGDGAALAVFTASIADNVVTLYLGADQAAKLAGGRAFWDCQITGPLTLTLASGQVDITGDVTV
jgi:hypothetical protein